MRVSDSIRYLARDIIRTYVKHIQHRIAINDSKYVLSGIDRDIDTYEELFEVVLKVVFNKGQDYQNFDGFIVEETAGMIDIMIADSKYSKIMKKYSEGVYDTCLLIYKKVEKGLIEGGK